MTLSINVYRRLPGEDALEFVDAGHPSEELGGFERCRYDLWGSSVARQLGLTLLPTLRDIYGVWAEDEDLATLEREARTLLDHLELVSQATGFEREYVAHRTGNILRAIDRARAIGGGVVIW